MNYLVEHPFIMVLIIAFIFMFFLSMDNRRAVKHRKHQMEIEKRKKNIK
jgi:uncharacterized membrane protein